MQSENVMRLPPGPDERVGQPPAFTQSPDRGDDLVPAGSGSGGCREKGTAAFFASTTNSPAMFGFTRRRRFLHRRIDDLIAPEALVEGAQNTQMR